MGLRPFIIGFMQHSANLPFYFLPCEDATRRPSSDNQTCQCLDHGLLASRTEKPISVLYKLPGLRYFVVATQYRLR
jgi:hypothetical protein